MASSGGQFLWQCSGYSLDVLVRQEKGTHVVAFSLRRSDGTPFDLFEYGARVSVPCSSDDAVWSYNRLAVHDIMHTDLETPFGFESAPNVGIPFALLADRLGVNRLALGLISQDYRASIRGALSEDRRNYALEIRKLDSLQTDRHEDTFFISLTQDTWFHQAQAYTKAVDQIRDYVPLGIPPDAYNPTYDSWYWTYDNINQELIWQLAQRSKSLGFKSLLVDAGWDTHAGQYFLWLDGSTGDYSPPPEAFPNFRGLLSRIRNQLGMRVMLWMQQYALGRRSVYYPLLAGSLGCVLDEVTRAPKETPALCPQVLGVHQHMIELFGRIMDAYRPDGFWFDWQEDIQGVCFAPHYHDYAQFGEGYNATQQAITDTIRQRDPDTLMEMRWPSANLNNKPYVQLWQPTDSPEDFEAMRLRAMNMRPFSAGVLMGTDEMYWSPKVSDVEAARFMASVVFTGVPYFGPNLLNEPESRSAMLRAWLEFYENNKEDLTRGNFEPYGDRDRPDQLIEGSRATFIYYRNRYEGVVPLTRANDKIYVVNASSSAGIDLRLTGLKPGTYRALISDLYLNARKSTQLPGLAKHARLRMDVPVGCLLTLTRVQ